jgi:hypothetical protein
MKNILRFLLLGLIVRCVDNKNEPLIQENAALRFKNDSLKFVIDSLTQSKSYIFENALINEKEDIEASLEVYRQILDYNEKDLWTVYAEERLRETTHKDEQPLKAIFRLSDTLIFRHRNDKCGEWGGDDEIIKIYQKKDYKKVMYEGDLFAIYKMAEYECDSLEMNPYDAKPKVHFSRHKKLNYELAKAAEECIFDLLKHKLNNDKLIYHAGVSNTVELKGSVAFVKSPSIFIDDYPSFGWAKFHLLKRELSK